mmetsp:Transcript_13663/g.29617  ORF Transcript_13663/g.29617 Transcript_13663/m.29617 type:complete len:527 (-) Transcript_13663:181-1761(-)|eukprot:CAMPEP_0172545834 /NCGR_PEP_ID=MMETSP1067-20121228/15690_1 /TAXON_ID=265564 ORGANISM="Thalassiosira punctigera, Strain Tpunct2005C2" /NCGR_SAMPLE_ID=MMETSP1067 /ASSEMBLY_ACC=CAM_ASM_000444 /LENGTH=526 /DNA_ID=CAMNT_0013332659 /DNA_START=9 /DNA_END=1589 /DNA_ORIENTATION=-
MSTGSGHRLVSIIGITLLHLGHSLSPAALTNTPQFLDAAHRSKKPHRASNPIGTLSRRTRLALSFQNDVDRETSRQLLDSLRLMRVKELKSELESLNVSTRNALEKEELVQRLYEARILITINGEGCTESRKSKKKKKRRIYDDDDDVPGEIESADFTASRGNPASSNNVINTKSESNSYNSDNTSHSNGWTITAPFVYHELETSKSVAARNANDIYIRPSAGKYAAIKVQLKKEGQSTPIALTLLVDTACSGLVLSPDAVARSNRQCPGIFQTIDNAGTMTMAGSSQGASVTKWDSYTKMMVGGVAINLANVAACQDIGALPSGLDGIMGLSFLDQYSCVDFDFVKNELRLEKTDSNPMIPNVNDVVARGKLLMTNLRIYTADITLDGRGPIKLVVDTGAASSFLNWKGVSDMRLSLSSPQIEPLRERIGAMGADNMALELTHRFTLQRRWNLVAQNNAVGDFCPGIGLGENERSNIDISDLPVLEALKGDGVGGILGADLLMMCDVVRFTGLNRGSPEMILIKH